MLNIGKNNQSGTASATDDRPPAKARAPKAASAQQRLNDSRSQARQEVGRKLGILDKLQNIFGASSKKPDVATNAVRKPRVFVSVLTPAWREEVKAKIRTDINEKARDRFENDRSNSAAMCTILKIKTSLGSMSGFDRDMRAGNVAIDSFYDALDQFLPKHASPRDDTSEKRFITLSTLAAICENSTEKNELTTTMTGEIRTLCEGLLSSPEKLNTSEYQKTMQQIREIVYQFAVSSDAAYNPDQVIANVRVGKGNF